MKVSIVIAFISLFYSFLYSQDSLLGYFNVDVSNSKVLISWSINAGNTCNGTTIYRSTDSLNFYQIGDIQGTCGDLSTTTAYSFTDQTPVPNSTNYYKLDLGGVEQSEVKGIEVYIIDQNSYLLYPNPITNSSKIKFNNNNLNDVTFTVYNEYGHIIQSVSGNADTFMLNSDQYSAGIYFFTLVKASDNTVIQGRFVDND